MEALTANIRILYEQKDITSELSDHLIGIVYTDHLSGQSDELSLEIMNKDGRWYNDWYPGHGDVLTLEWGWNNTERIKIGRFEIDEIEFNFSPSTISIHALAVGIKTSVRTKVDIAYENKTLNQVVKQIADRQGFTLVGAIEPISLDRLTQQESDLVFLKKLADEYDYAFKIDEDKLVFYSISELENLDAVANMTMTDIISGTIRDQIKSLPQSVVVKHHNPATKSTVSYEVKNDEITTASSSVRQTATSSDTIQTSNRATSIEVATAKAKAEMNKANREKTTGSLVLIGKPNYLSGNVLNLTDAGQLQGRYLITSGTHHISRNGGSESSIEVKRITQSLAVTGSQKQSSKKVVAYNVNNGEVIKA